MAIERFHRHGYSKHAWWQTWNPFHPGYRWLTSNIQQPWGWEQQLTTMTPAKLQRKHLPLWDSAKYISWCFTSNQWVCFLMCLYYVVFVFLHVFLLCFIVFPSRSFGNSLVRSSVWLPMSQGIWIQQMIQPSLSPAPCVLFWWFLLVKMGSAEWRKISKHPASNQFALGTPPSPQWKSQRLEATDNLSNYSTPPGPQRR